MSETERDDLREFQEGLTKALNEHGVPAMPSWREAIDWLAAHGGQPDLEFRKTVEALEALARAVELVIGYLPNGPTLSAFGIARTDCALVHMDYFGDIESAKHGLAEALAAVRGTDAASILREFGLPPRPCDNACCADPETAKAARTKHIASYTNVKEWVEVPSSVIQE
jgi:hypothetical protein